MSRLRQQCEEPLEEHDVSKELFLGIMMLMLCLGIMILNATQPVWRVHRHDPVTGDAVIIYTSQGMGMSEDGYSIVRRLDENGFRNLVSDLVIKPNTDLHLFLKGGNRTDLVRHASYADSLLSTDQAGNKVRTAVYIHTW
jgi:hypothetical protein